MLGYCSQRLCLDASQKKCMLTCILIFCLLESLLHKSVLADTD